MSINEDRFDKEEDSSEKKVEGEIEDVIKKVGSGDLNEEVEVAKEEDGND